MLKWALHSRSLKKINKLQFLINYFSAREYKECFSWKHPEASSLVPGPCCLWLRSIALAPWTIHAFGSKLDEGSFSLFKGTTNLFIYFFLLSTTHIETTFNSITPQALQGYIWLIEILFSSKNYRLRFVLVFIFLKVSCA